MKRIKLSLKDIKVESFETVPNKNVSQGTVMGNAQDSTPIPCDYSRVPTDCLCTINWSNCNTCHQTCDGIECLSEAATMCDTCPGVGQECDRSIGNCT